MRIAVLGVGSVGGVLVGSLADTDAHILCVSRGQTATTLESGLVLKNPEGAIEMIPSERFTLHDSEKGPVPGTEMNSYDAAIVAGKAASTPVLASIANDLLSPDGVAISIQNGLGHAEGISHAVGRDRALVGSTTHSAWRDGDGVVNWSGRGSITMGRTDDTGPSGNSSSLLGYFADSGLNPVWSSNMEGVIWMKLLINVAINPVCAIAGVRNGALAEVPELWEQSLGAMREAEEVAIASGVDLGDFEPESFLREVVLATSGNRVSMLQDLMAGRKTEVDALCGMVIKKGREAGVPTPRNEMMLALIRGIEMSPHFD